MPVLDVAVAGSPPKLRPPPPLHATHHGGTHGTHHAGRYTDAKVANRNPKITPGYHYSPFPIPTYP
jgi:hypothetical protein